MQDKAELPRILTGISSCFGLNSDAAFVIRLILLRHSIAEVSGGCTEMILSDVQLFGMSKHISVTLLLFLKPLLIAHIRSDPDVDPADVDDRTERLETELVRRMKALQYAR